MSGAHLRAYFRPDQTSISVLPDFMPPGALEIATVRANGIDVTRDHKSGDPGDFQVSLKDLAASPESGTIELEVEFRTFAASA